MANTYDTYKDSGIAWIGEIPSEWEVCRVKNEYSFQTGATPPTGREDYFEGDNIWVSIADMKDKYIFDSKKKLSDSGIQKCSMSVVPKGSLLYSFKLSVGNVAFAGADLYTNEAIASFFPNFGYIPFLYYTAPQFVVFNANTNIYGANILNQELIKNAWLPLPPLHEQQSIANFLDKKCGEIDSLIGLQEEMISELQAYKQSVITEAVTKGLNPNAKMKDSGVDWIGEIPEEWEVCKLKALILSISSGCSVNAENDSARGDEYGVLKTSCVSKNYFIPSENKKVYVNEYGRVKCPVKADTVIVSRMNTPELVGAAAYCDRDIPNIFLPDRIWQVNFQKDNICVKFVWYYLISTNTKHYYTSLSAGTSSSMQNISQSQFENAYIVYPNKDEQHQIASYLDAKTQQIDSLIALKQEKISELKDYKKSIIYEYVTGKKRV